MPRLEGTLEVYTSRANGSPRERIWPAEHGQTVHLQAYTQYQVVDYHDIRPFYIEESTELHSIMYDAVTYRARIGTGTWRSVPMVFGLVRDGRHPENPALKVVPGMRPGPAPEPVVKAVASEPPRAADAGHGLRIDPTYTVHTSILSREWSTHFYTFGDLT